MRRAAVVAIAVAGWLVGLAAPASAHGQSDKPRPGDFASRILAVENRIAGVEVSLIADGDEIEVTNDSGRTLIVPGYQGEPYLRLDDRGVWENRRSPAVYLNADRDASTAVPGTADPEAEPKWRRVSGSNGFRWHDHRIHWMGDGRPPAAERDPSATHVILRWSLDVVADGDDIMTVRGDLRWFPTPSPWPWVAAGAVVAAGGLWLLRRRRWVVALTALVIVAVTLNIADVAGRIAAATWLSTDNRVFIGFFPAFGWASAVVAVVVARRRRRAWPEIPAAFAGLTLAVMELDHVSVLWRARPGASLPLGVARAATVASVAIGAVLVVITIRGGPGVSEPAGSDAEPAVV